MSTTIDIIALEPSRYGVTVREGELATTHKVAVSEEFIDDLGIVDVDPSEVVRETFAYLLESQPASAIQGDFPLDQIAEQHPDLFDELRTRLS